MRSWSQATRQPAATWSNEGEVMAIEAGAALQGTTQFRGAPMTCSNSSTRLMRRIHATAAQAGARAHQRQPGGHVRGALTIEADRGLALLHLKQRRLTMAAEASPRQLGQVRSGGSTCQRFKAKAQFTVAAHHSRLQSWWRRLGAWRSKQMVAGGGRAV